MKKNNIKLLGVFATVLLLVIVITASFAYFGSFNVNLNNNVAVNVNSVSPGDATFISNATQLNLQVPAANMSQTASNNEVAAVENTATLTVNLTGAANLLTTCTYDIVYEYDAGSNVYGKSPTTKNGNKEITLQVSNVNGTNNFVNEKNFDFDSSWTSNKRTLVSGATISSNGTLTTQNISITGKYYNLTIPQTSIEGKAFTGKIYVTNHSCSTSEPAYIKLLNAYGGKGSITELPDSAFASKTTANDKGMYKAQDDLGTSYYYRGAVDNNWVKFGKDSSGNNIYWRIIRINGDGSIRMIYTGTTAPTESTKVVMTGEGTQIGTSKFNSSYNQAEYVGYMYTSGQQHGNSESSTIKTTIENWYETTTLKDNPLVSKDQIFCNDRTASTSDVAYSTTNYTTLTSWNSTGTTYYYGASGRVWNDPVSPDYKCPVASDKFTTTTAKGNGKLSYPVGLISADEITFAGLPAGNTNNSFYLYTGDYYWAGSPYDFDSDDGAYEFSMFGNGRSNSVYVGYRGGVRGVVSLSSKAKLSGNGTYNDVYTVVGDNSTEDTSSGKSFETAFVANNTDTFNENGLRYEGADPNNYICLDNKTGGACSDSSLLFRIIGLFDEEYSSDGTSSSGTKKLLKVIDTNAYGGTSGKKWDSGGRNNWNNASLKAELNGTYLTTLLRTSNVNSKLSNGIVSAKWHLGGASESNYLTLTAEGIYREERNASAIWSSNPASIYATVGLMYPSDYGYATIGGSTTNKAGCRAQALNNWNNSSYSDCKNNDWIFKSATFVNAREWFISHFSPISDVVAYLVSSGAVILGSDGSAVSELFAVRPTFYLDSSILKIVGTGDGTSSNPYRIG